MKNKIKFKIPVANPTVGKEEAEAVYKKINSGWISMGPEVHLFENKVKSSSVIILRNSKNRLHLGLYKYPQKNTL